MSLPKKNELEDQAVENFRAYLRIQSVQPNPDYDGCVNLIKKLGDEIGLPVTVYEFVKGKPIVILKWEGTDPTLPSILFNSHMDVVPVYPELWEHDPFGAEMASDGNIYARGAQDDKCIGIQYLEAIRRLILNGQKIKRTVYISFVPDEEIGGTDGMKLFVTKQEFKDLNVGCAFDEGGPSPVKQYLLFYTERIAWQAEIKVTGTEGHGSGLMTGTAAEKLRNLIDRLLDFRQTQVDILNQNPNLSLGDVTSLNLTILQGGVEINVIPPEFTASIDIRIDANRDLPEFEEQLQKWCEESGDGIKLTFLAKDERVEPTKLDETNPYWIAFQNKANEMNVKLYKMVLFAVSDARHIRKLDIPVFGFSPMNYTTNRIHANNEYLNKYVFLKGIRFYEEIIPAVANF